jgi:nitroimidazol reductase NimA-like FMN-containing flavoprotein (pyridoxamine 5'-phosphate oxidase superfamily)
MNEAAPSDRTTVKRLPKRAAYDRATVHAILDAGMVCHVGFLVDGQPCVIPTLYVRLGEHLYLHGSPASRMLQAIAGGGTVSVAVTLIDGLVLARSAFHHSVNYRSVVVFGTASLVEDAARKNEVLRGLSEHVIRGRWDEIRVPSAEELRRTMVVSIPIDEASAKVRTGSPLDDEEDYALPIWAGVLPLRTVAGEPIRDARCPPELATPGHVVAYRGPGAVGE